MSEGPHQPIDPVSPPTPPPAPTVVVGYPSTATSPAPAGPTNPGMANLRGQVRTVRYLLMACLVLLVVLIFGLGMALSSSRTQLDDLRAQVAALGQQSVAAPAAVAPVATAQPAPQATGAPQLPAAVALTGAAIPAGADATGAMLIGDPEAANVVEVYVDYQCPYCQRWEQTIGSVLADKAMTPGSDLLIKQYNLAFLGETSQDLTPAGASARAASAAACIIDRDGVGIFVPFSRSLFATADPNEPPGQFTEKDLVALAKQAGASPAAIDCISAEENVPFVSATTKSGFARGVGGTPTVVVNGTTLANPFSDPALDQLVSAS